MLDEEELAVLLHAAEQHDLDAAMVNGLMDAQLPDAIDDARIDLLKRWQCERGKARLARERFQAKQKRMIAKADALAAKRAGAESASAKGLPDSARQALERAKQIAMAKKR